MYFLFYELNAYKYTAFFSRDQIFLHFYFKNTIFRKEHVKIGQHPCHFEQFGSGKTVCMHLFHTRARKSPGMHLQIPGR